MVVGFSGIDPYDTRWWYVQRASDLRWVGWFWASQYNLYTLNLCGVETVNFTIREADGKSWNKDDTSPTPRWWAVSAMPAGESIVYWIGWVYARARDLDDLRACWSQKIKFKVTDLNGVSWTPAFAGLGDAPAPSMPPTSSEDDGCTYWLSGPNGTKIPIGKLAPDDVQSTSQKFRELMVLAKTKAEESGPGTYDLYVQCAVGDIETPPQKTTTTFQVAGKEEKSTFAKLALPGALVAGGLAIAALVVAASRKNG